MDLSFIELCLVKSGRNQWHEHSCLQESVFASLQLGPGTFKQAQIYTLEWNTTAVVWVAIRDKKRRKTSRSCCLGIWATCCSCRHACWLQKLGLDDHQRSFPAQRCLQKQTVCKSFDEVISSSFFFEMGQLQMHCYTKENISLSLFQWQSLLEASGRTASRRKACTEFLLSSMPI